MRRADQDGNLKGFFVPPVEPTEHALAEVEGWILGIK